MACGGATCRRPFRLVRIVLVRASGVAAYNENDGGERVRSRTRSA